ncbi:MAG: hypothetical protein IJU37_10895 [Desulfovibrio sp.]|nr:hypothetical protein [Desulfovibrio sp.]
MSFIRICAIFGNGDILAGEKLLRAIANRLLHARAKHPVFAEGVYQGLSRITSEHDELVRAVEHETPERQQDEVLDVLATSVRFANKEYAFSS